MMKRTFPYNSAIFAALLIAIGCAGNAFAQQSKSESISYADFIRMLGNQPDHQADRTIVRGNAIVKMKFAKKQGRVRQEFCPMDLADNLKDESFRSYRIITISQADKPTLALDPQEETYAEAPEAFGLVSFDVRAFVDSMVKAAGELNVVITRVGSEMIDGHPSTKIKFGFKGEQEAVNFYFANDLKNLFLKMDSGDIKEIKGSYSVSNISFEIPDELFDIPKNYKKVEFNTMLSSIKQKAVK